MGPALLHKYKKFNCKNLTTDYSRQMYVKSLFILLIAKLILETQLKSCIVFDDSAYEVRHTKDAIT